METCQKCTPECQYESLIGNGICDQEANNEDCQYDGGDCCYADCKVCSDGNCNSDASKCIGNTEAGAQLWMYDAATMKLKNKNGPWEFSDETFSKFPQNSGDTSSVLTDEDKVLN